MEVFKTGFSLQFLHNIVYLKNTVVIGINDVVNIANMSGLVFYFCCNNCLNNFTKDPVKHVAKLKGSDNKKCIFQDKDVDAGKKFVIGFCCGNCLGGFAKEPAKHIAKVKK